MKACSQRGLDRTRFVRVLQRHKSSPASQQQYRPLEQFRDEGEYPTKHGKPQLQIWKFRRKRLSVGGSIRGEARGSPLFSAFLVLNRETYYLQVWVNSPNPLDPFRTTHQGRHVADRCQNIELPLFFAHQRQACQNTTDEVEPKPRDSPPRGVA